MARRLLLDNATGYGRRRVKPPGVDNPSIFMVRAVSLRLPRRIGRAEAGHPFMRAKTWFRLRLPALIRRQCDCVHRNSVIR